MINREEKRFFRSGRRGSLLHSWYRLHGSLFQPMLTRNIPGILGGWSWPGTSMVRAKKA